MKSTSIRIILSLCLLLTVGLASAAKNDNDPGPSYLRAYTMAKEAEKELASNPAPNAPALKKLKESLAILENVAKANPNWQREVVEYRITSIKNSVARFEKTAEKPETKPQPPATTAKPEEPLTLSDIIKELKSRQDAPRDRMLGGTDAAEQRDAMLLLLAEEVERLRAEVETLKKRK
jgi:hypothetical protein